MIDIIKESWGWTGINPVKVVRENEFGNLIIKDSSGKYWRLCPEDIYCTIVANTKQELEALSNDQEFLHDWQMVTLVETAKEKLGPLSEGRKYCLKVPGILGGEYGGNNLATISLAELISASGHIGKQIKDLPDGTEIELKVTE